ncbi:MAG TPA: AsmA family protein [Cellvibrio sp.]|nr:AsmA family protein [Cellvibrio sp.]
MTLERIRHHKIASIIGVLVLVLLIAVAVVIIYSETLVRMLVEDRGSKSLGRELRIDGPLSVDWHWTFTEIHAEKIRLSNAPDYKEPEMIRIESVDLSFKPLKLLIGKLEFGVITVHKPIIILERKSREDANWNFPMFSAANATSESVAPDNRHKFPLIERLELNDGQLVFRDAVKKLSLNLKLNSVSGSGGEKKDSKKSENGFSVKGKGTLQGEKFDLVGSGGSLETLRDSTADFPLQLQLIMGATQVNVNGTFKDPLKFSGANASLKIRGDSLADIFYLTAIPLPPTPPYTLEGQLTKDGDVWGYQKFNGKVGGSDLSGSLSYDVSGERGFLKANLFSNVLNSADLGGFIGLTPDVENATPEQKKESAKKKASPKLIPDVPLKVERLRATDLDVTLVAKEINAPNLPFKGMEVRFDLKDGLLKLNPFKVILADGTIEGAIEVDARPDVPPMTVDLTIHKLSLAQFFVDTRFENTTRGFFGGKISLKGVGASLADVLGTSNGEMAIIMSGGKISQLLIEASDVDVGQALPLFLGKDKSTTIRCGVIDFDVKDGMLKSKTVVLDTNDSLLVGRVGVDLKREKISARLDAKPKDNSILSAQIPITLSGDLKSPGIGIDMKRTGARGAAAIALGTFLTPFAAFLAFIETGDAKHADCRALITIAEGS